VAYLRVAGILRADIASGRFAPGGRLPSESQLMIRHGVSRSVAKWAIGVLKADGLADGRQGAGVFVRSPSRLVRRPQLAIPMPAHCRPTVDDGAADPWPYQVDEVRADADTARRLTVPLDTVLRRTRYQQAGLEPQQLITSWQPQTNDDVVPRWLSERVIARPALPDEIEALGLPARGCVLHITRTYSADGAPIETADIVLAIDQVELHYELPIN
jgi:GntR family transcriptional regulator